MTKISKLNLNYVTFHFLYKLVHLRSLLGKLFHNAYNQYNLLLVVQRQFDLLYNRPKEPSPAHPSDKHVHIVCIRCMFDKSEHCVT